jgi:hypothetical protein
MLLGPTSLARYLLYEVDLRNRDPSAVNSSGQAMPFLCF